MRADRLGAARGFLLWAGVLSLALGRPATAFDSKGHNVVEATAYRTLIEGRDGQPSRVEVLRYLINDGALDAPYCFGWGDKPPRDCATAPGRNPLLCWPQPETDRPDAFFRRQFSDPGQCFHYMGTLTDALSDPFPGTSVPRSLATSAVVRCNDLLDGLLRQIVVDGGPGTRRSGFGLYEMMHAVADSFSGAHTERAGERVDYLRVWKPIEKLPGIPTSRSKKIPDGVYHEWDDHRDKAYVLEGSETACETRTDHPYDVPYECLSEEGNRARLALVDLLVLVRDLRAAQLAAPPGTDTKPERSAAWRSYRAKWFTAVHPCEEAECAVRQPPDPATGRYAFLGLDARYNATAKYVDVAARGTVLRYAEDINPFVYTLNASLGYRSYEGGGNAGFAALGFDFTLPIGFKAAIGFTPAEVRAVVGASAGSADVVTRLLRFQMGLGERLALTLDAPLEVNWRKPQAQWSFGVGLNYGLGSRRFVGGDTLLHHDKEKSERLDAAWAPPPAPYGRLQGRVATLYFITGISVTQTPTPAVEGQAYGLGMLGVEMGWDRDRWGGKYPFTPVVSLAAGYRRTSGESGYLTGTLGVGVRWYVLGPLGLSVTAVRVEGGPKIRGGGEVDATEGVRGPPGSEYYLLAGSRVGVAFRAGIFDLLVEGPTIAWSSDPFGSKEILSFRLGIRLQ
ncbi:MAG TPA: hypothetical protein PLB02_03130 [Thermoanaerobaculia bacterium]|nr:hypothetical protein [Thermoanaerobaculia bacterium]HQR66365.1 hypothetical protein [Thermoanaerobaculia bacterium]